MIIYIYIKEHREKEIAHSIRTNNLATPRYDIPLS